MESKWNASGEWNPRPIAPDLGSTAEYPAWNLAAAPAAPLELEPILTGLGIENPKTREQHPNRSPARQNQTQSRNPAPRPDSNPDPDPREQPRQNPRTRERDFAQAWEGLPEPPRDLAKRAFDVLVALVGLAALALVFPVVALLIKMNDAGPVLYSQTRVGRRGRLFKMYKFRTMVANAERLKRDLMVTNERGADGEKCFKVKHDPRITPVGRFLRKFSIDEAPQFWNVLKGDMSVVGPRPPVPDEVAAYTPREMRRLDVTPGITCYWQIQGRADLTFAQQVELDLQYIQNAGLATDLRILLKTPLAVLKAKGAY